MTFLKRVYWQFYVSSVFKISYVQADYQVHVVLLISNALKTTRPKYTKNDILWIKACIKIFLNARKIFQKSRNFEKTVKKVFDSNSWKPQSFGNFRKFSVDFPLYIYLTVERNKILINEVCFLQNIKTSVWQVRSVQKDLDLVANSI